MRIRERGQMLTIQSVPLAFQPVFLCMYVFFGGLALILFVSLRAEPHSESWLPWYGVSIPAFIGLCFFVSGLFINRKKDVHIDKSAGLLTIDGQKRASLKDVKAVQISRNRTGPESSTYTIGLLLSGDNAVLGAFARAESQKIASHVSRFLGEPIVQQPDQLDSEIKKVLPPGPPMQEQALPFGSQVRQALGSSWLGGICFVFGLVFLSTGSGSSQLENAPSLHPLVAALVHGAALAAGVALLGGAFFFGRRTALAILYPPVLLDRASGAIRVRGSKIAGLAEVRAVGLSTDDSGDSTTYCISLFTGIQEEHLIYKSWDGGFVEQGAARMAAFLQRPIWKFFN